MRLEQGQAQVWYAWTEKCRHPQLMEYYRSLLGADERERCERFAFDYLKTEYLLTRARGGGFLGDHSDVGNWRCPLGIAALSVESVIILLSLLVAAGAWQARIHAAYLAASARPATRRMPEHSHA